MRTFKDSAGREWQIVITIGEALRVRGLIEVDLLKPHLPRDGQDVALVDEIEIGPELFAKIVYALVRSQADADPKVDESAFMALMDGATIAGAREAFRGELTDFFQSQPQIVALLKKQVELGQAVAAEIDKMTAADAIAATKMSGNSSTTSQESSGSTPAP